MQRQNIIVVIEIWTHTPEVFGNFKKACDELKLPYHSLKMKSFPIEYKDFIIYKVEFK
jgi:uncharacterized protein (DUF2384 family)